MNPIFIWMLVAALIMFVVGLTVLILIEVVIEMYEEYKWKRGEWL